MSYNKSVKKAFCKVCLDAGKTEQEYTSHYVRSLPDKNGNTVVTCPVLKATPCSYCSEKGHTISFCQKKKKDAAKAQYNSQVKVTPLKPASITKPVVFSNLIEDSEDEDTADFPTLKPNIAIKTIDNQVKKEVKTGWATIAKIEVVKKPAPWAAQAQNQEQTKKSWADWSDSDCDSECEEYAVGELSVTEELSMEEWEQTPWDNDSDISDIEYEAVLA